MIIGGAGVPGGALCRGLAQARAPGSGADLTEVAAALDEVVLATFGK